MTLVGLNEICFAKGMLVVVQSGTPRLSFNKVRSMLAATQYQHGEKVDLFKYDFLFYVESFDTCLTSAEVRFSMNFEVQFSRTYV